jgi:hypothetical protein
MRTRPRQLQLATDSKPALPAAKCQDGSNRRDTLCSQSARPRRSPRVVIGSQAEGLQRLPHLAQRVFLEMAMLLD